MIQKSNTCAGFISAFSRSIKGFTLIELLVVVIIIAVLTAVAMPMYKRAVYKIRFSKLMLPAKSLASANEAFYLGNGEYATTVASLDVGGETAALPDGSTVDLQDTDNASFVRLSNDEVPHVRYVVYQQKSANFAGTTMCEAEGDDDRATWLCDKGLNGTIVEDANGNSGANGWTAYLLTGTAEGNFPMPCPTGAVCDENGDVTGCATGYHSEGNECVATPPCPEGATCNEQGAITACASGQTLNNGVCEDCATAFPNATACSTTSYAPTACSEGYIVNGTACEPDPTVAQLQALAASLCPANQTQNVCTINSKNGTVSKCDTRFATINEQGECVSNGTPGWSYGAVYNLDGTLQQEYMCFDASSGHCYYGAVEYRDGRMSKTRKCANRATLRNDGTCTNNRYENYGEDYMLDSNGEWLALNECSSVDTSGNCRYSSMYIYNGTTEHTCTFIEPRNARGCITWDPPL